MKFDLLDIWHQYHSLAILGDWLLSELVHQKLNYIDQLNVILVLKGSAECYVLWQPLCPSYTTISYY